MNIQNIRLSGMTLHSLPVVAPNADEAFSRYYIRASEPHQYTHFFSVLQSNSLAPFEAEYWLTGTPLGGISVLLAKNIRVVGPSVLFAGSQPFIPSEEYPGYLRDVVNHPSRKDRLHELNENAADNVIESAFVISHIHAKIYGHFLLEIAPKVLIIKMYYEQGIRLPIVLSSRDPSYISEFIRLAIPDAQIIVAESEKGLLVESCLLPSQLNTYLLTPSHSAFFDAIAQSCLALHGHEDLPEKVLISRAGIPSSYRELENWTTLASIAVDHGYCEINPEKLPLTKQIAIFSNASSLVGEYGSALHNSVFSSRRPFVISLNWVNLVQQAIGLARGQRNIFILGDGGQPVLAPSPATTHTVEPHHFRVDTELFKNVLGFVEGKP
jgi:capsular polysaccharide biosynthesis protein